MTVNKDYEAVVVMAKKAFMVCAVKDQRVFVHSSAVSRLPIPGVDDFFEKGQKVLLKIVGFDQLRGRWLGSYQLANAVNLAERTRPLPSAGGFKRLKEATMASAVELAQKKRPLASQKI